MKSPDSIRSHYESAFARFERGLNGGASTPLHLARRRGLAAFAETGFPTTAEEEWRFTSVAPIAAIPFVPAPSASAGNVSAADVRRWALPGGVLLVFVNGRFAPDLSALPPLPRGARIGSLAAALAADPSLLVREFSPEAGAVHDAFGALNTAFLTDGAYVSLDDGVALDQPVHILSLVAPGSEPLLVLPRHLILAGAGARVNVLETYGGTAPGGFLTDAVTEIRAGEGAVVEHDTLQMEGPAAYHVGTTLVTLGRGGSFTSNAIMLGGALTRNNVNAVFAGEDAECTLNGLSVATGTQHIDNHTVIDHALPRCRSHELYKAVLDGSSRGVFNGKIVVRQDAQKTDAKQTNRTLLLSDEATVDTKPQLEIFADDVKCTHGAAVGQLDEEQLFYLRSRGIDAEDARDILTFAFASDVINRVHVDALRERLDTLLHARLRQGRVSTES
ncbi:MAG TPA: Fe-S cluster assembly protein SufD [Bacteroidota bacterium]|nr:Fe-S cluster assembly protein SufD [Bacteroidota bacterium]